MSERDPRADRVSEMATMASRVRSRTIDRRTTLHLLAAAAIVGGAPSIASCSRSTEKTSPMTTSPASHSGKPPILFLAHGAPPLLDDASWIAELAEWAKRLPRPKAVLMLSAHWDARPAKLGATQTVPLVYDFYGFPERFYSMKYPAPGAPELAARVRELLDAQGIAHVDEATRGLDHGAYIPLFCMYPEADVPVLQLSLPGLDPKTLVQFGRALAPLADEGVLVIGSGFLTHNLRTLGRPTPSWANEFDAWAAEALGRLDVDTLADFVARAPSAHIAHPTHEHYAPVIVAAAAAAEKGRTDVTFPITGFWNGMSFTRRSVQFG